MQSSTTNWKLVGGELSLDFVNTSEWHASSSPQERLKDYEDLLIWSRYVGILDDTTMVRLRREASRRSAEAQTVLEQAIAIREVLYRIFVAITEKQQPDNSDIEALNHDLSYMLTHLRLDSVHGGFSWEWRNDHQALDSMLWPILHSAAELLVSERRERIGHCEDLKGCGWLFLDTSKNRSRRWCDMKDCGNRAKAHRHYQRHRRQTQKKV
jgi:predicted RNA-binding Zn ribbon-like protein